MSNRTRILVVEDMPDWAAILKDPLEQEGYAVELALNYRRVVDLLRRPSHNVFSLAVIDLRLSEIDQENREGLDLIHWFAVNNDISGRLIPVIVVTGYGTPELMRETLKKHGVVAFLEKNKFDRQEYLRIAKEAIAKFMPRSRRELTPEQRKKLDELTRRLFRGEVVRFE